MTLPIIRTERPRLIRAADDPDYRFELPRDPVRKRILSNILKDCEDVATQRPWKRIPERPDSPHPFHQLYLAFYTGMHATALIEHYAFAWRVTRDARWLKCAKAWLLAAAGWEHSDRIEEHFYTANRYMQALALALDLLHEALSCSERKAVTDCLAGQMARWWPDVDSARHSPEGGHHAVVDNGHFGVAALCLLGEHPMAETWLAAVIDRFRSGIMPNGCGRDGEPADGPSFWPWENLWMLQFGDALRNVTGIDLYREFPLRLTRPLKWLRYHLAVPAKIPDETYSQGNTNLIGASNLRSCSVALLRLAQEARDPDLRDVALSDPHIGRLFRFGVGVKGSTAECITAYGPSAYCYYDPKFRAKRRSVSLALSRKFTRARYGETAILRTGWEPNAVVACVSGYSAGGAHSFSNLQVQWRGYPLLRTISAVEARPVGCGCLPSVGGQNECYARIGRLETTPEWDRLAVTSLRLHQTYLLLRGKHPILLVAARRKTRGVRLVGEKGLRFARLNGRDYLQYAREAHFNPSAGALHMRVRLRDEADPDRPQVLFNAGLGIAQLMGSRVNNFNLGFPKTEGLAFAVQSQRYNVVQVEAPPKVARMIPGRWHDVSISWGGFNAPKGRPFIELELDGCRVRCDDVARFGELGRDTQKLASRSTPRTFYIDPNAELGFGAAVQMPDTGIRCDIAQIDLRCPGREPLSVSFEEDLGPEVGGGAITWKLNPAHLRSVVRNKAVFGAGRRAVDIVPVRGEAITLEIEDVPYAPSGLAAGSLRRLIPNAEAPSKRLRVSTEGDEMVWAIAERGTKRADMEEALRMLIEKDARRQRNTPL